LADVLETVRDFTFLDPTITEKSRESQKEFKTRLIRHYAARSRRERGKTRCLVTDRFIPTAQCTAAHILPWCRRALLPIFGIPGLRQEVNINEISNGFLWAEKIEDAYTKNQVCMIYNPFVSKLVFVVLDASILNDPLAVDDLTFNDVHFKQLDVSRDQMPSLRLLLNQTVSAVKKANLKGWPRTSNFDQISRMLDAMRDVLGRMRDDELDSKSKMESWAHENPNLAF
jgi:hypothetical protein